MSLITYHRGNNNKGYYVKPSGEDTKVGLVVLQEWWGLNKQMEGLTERLAAEGLHALCPDLYHGRVASTADEAAHLMDGLDWGKAIEEIGEAVQYLKDHGSTKVVVTGFCMGGALANATAVLLAKDIAGAAPFYGVPPKSVADMTKAAVPIQAHFGAEDDMKGFSDRATQDQYEQNLKASGVDYKLYRYEGAGHAFMNEKRPEAYNSTASSQAFQRLIAFARAI
ncbi:dienelactone hydrolase [Piptocephalis cylindrospora]|uniref:Dienelactone hydrolase n=1 Tax=Piptocephalis cylindrospora TaxID=1907219 RepID=A0A4P9Y6V7_9FUNG|nr:dienelactone hydrolase [Piptocephalis cylindrospora]|eukprot:RKP14434.1 dienelactone hydrolase [Piptocephalis cylindrospora]